MTFELEKLPYDESALEPAISAETMKLHYGKHHAGYVDKLNDAVKGTERENMTLEAVIQWASEAGDRIGIFNNAAQAWNHAFFWKSMTPGGGGMPEGDLKAAIENSFGSYDKFRDAFIEAGAGRFGSGWVWLVLEEDEVKIVSTPNAETPVTSGATPLLTCDLWEHAYYLDYQNKRAAFLETFIDKLANWSFAAENFAMKDEHDEKPATAVAA